MKQKSGGFIIPCRKCNNKYYIIYPDCLTLINLYDDRNYCIRFVNMDKK